MINYELSEADAHDFELHHTTWHSDFSHIAHLLAQQTLCNRSLDGNLVLTQICLTFTYNGVSQFHAVLHILQLHLRKNLHLILLRQL